ncbi:kinesin motor protein cin8 [Tulasnella sp. 408]|nr:kinesin motor protein cin8 [Tulasnella sp. 408]
MEETLSTLDYALRAKSIRNKPEINQRMTRNGLLKEYVGEIEKPKADLVAPREKNGIGFSKESWEHQQLKMLYEENRKQVETIASQMRAVREEFEQGMALLMKSEGRLKETKEKLTSTEGWLRWTETELQETEEHLDGVARSLKTVAKESAKDVEGLSSTTAVTTSSPRIQGLFDSIARLSSYSTQLEGRFRTFAKDHEQRVMELTEIVMQLRRNETEALAKYSASITSQPKRLADAAEIVRAKDNAQSEATSEFAATLLSMTDAIIRTFADWEDDLKEGD